ARRGDVRARRRPHHAADVPLHRPREVTMPLDPEARMLMDQMQGMMRPFNELSIEEARAAIVALSAAAGEPEAVARVENRTVPGPRGEIPVSIYTPEGRAPFPVLVFLHGSGWVFWSIGS